LRYRRDLVPGDELERAEALIDDLRAATRSRDAGAISTYQAKLTEWFQTQFAGSSGSHFGGLVETVIASVVMLLGIWTYFGQAFKIPTGSMQPTLHGVVGYPDANPAPQFWRQAIDFALFGRTYVEAQSESEAEDWVTEVRPAQIGLFWDGAEIAMASGRKYQVGCRPEVLSDLGLRRNARFKRDEVIVRGYVELGDQLFVDKLSYHFAPPRRGEVFVFTTAGIFGIAPYSGAGSQNYIKRIAGIPGDTLQIVQPWLYINGKEATETPFVKVARGNDGYSGYRNDAAGSMNYLKTPHASVAVPAHCYFALGDNSAGSFDSRFWGFVPEKNVVGRGYFVYWPFTSRWGFVR
jgi:signal peptidase I